MAEMFSIVCDRCGAIYLIIESFCPSCHQINERRPLNFGEDIHRWV
jgi:uncharacterized OB-fold protein